MDATLAPGRIAILDRGIGARRVLRVLRELHRGGQGWVPVALHGLREHRARFVREAAEARRASGSVELALKEARVGSAWVGPLTRRERLVAAEACARAGVQLVAAPLQAQLALGEVLAAPPGAQLLEVVVVRDLHSGAWAFEPAAVSRGTGGPPSLVRLPAPEAEGLGPELRRLALEAAAGAGWLGVGAARFAAWPGQAPRLLGLEAAAESALALELAVGDGLDLTRLQLEVFLGRRLEAAPPAVRAAAVGTSLHATDARPRTLALLRLPASPAVRCDAAAEEGDEAGADGALVAVAARGADPAEAGARLAQALLDTDLVLHGGGVDKGPALAMLDPAAARRQPELALLAAALEAYEEGLERERARFLAEARRGLPRVGPAQGRSIELRLDGQLYLLQVLQSGPLEYSVRSGGGPAVTVRLERSGPFERLLWVGGQRHRVLVDLDGLRQLVEVAGLSHLVQRDPSGMVVSPSPAVVVSVEVAPGEAVEAGAPLARVESMKLQLLVTAPRAGVVREVLVTVNAQVDAGTPLVRLEPTGDRAAEAAPTSLLLPREPEEADPRRAWSRGLRRLLLGYDVSAEEARALGKRAAELCAAPVVDPQVQEEERWALGCFAEVQELFSRATPADPEREPRAPLEELWRYLHEPAARGQGLAPPFLARLERALGLYGASLEEPSRELELALLRLWKAHARAEEQLPALLPMLERHLREAPGALPQLAAPPAWRGLLDRLAEIGQGRFPALTDLAREVRYRRFDQPGLLRVRAEEYAHAEADLAALRRATAEHQGEVIARLVNFRFPLSGRLIEAMAADGARADRLLEALLRRYYRIRPLEPVVSQGRDGVPVAHGWYQRPSYRVRLAAVHARGRDLPRALAVLAALAGEAPPEAELVLEAFVWSDGTLPVPELLSEHLKEALDRAGFRRPVRRVVITVATAGRPGQHFTFRRPEEAFAEDLRYRGVHPTLFERMQLRRLSEFNLERLPAAEDIYLYRAVARANTRDERLFACAEVRDVTPLRDEHGRLLSVPHLERVLLEAFAGIRLVQARRPPGERLEWNRVFLSVIPELQLTRAELRRLAERLAPASEGLGLEMVLVSARMPEQEGGPARETLVRIISTERGDVQLQFDEPTDRPLAPLAELQKRIVQLRRRGLVHPVEVTRMLAPPAGAQEGVPHGDFAEYELDESGQLAPVQRAPGNNTANVVVGVVRNFTARYPEGMKRVVILGDGSRETGSVAEPECRRIIAALDLAERLQVPCEWFALSAGAKISTRSGTENMDWVSRALRRIIEYTQGGGELNVVVCGINVGAQPYWNAEATMLMHTRGILVMVPGSAMVLTGKQALEYSGAVSAEDNEGIGGYERIMGPNGQAQYRATSLPDAIQILLAHHQHCYRAPGERFPRPAPTSDPKDRDVREFPHGPVGGGGFATIGEVFSEEKNPGRNRPFDIRRVMAAVTDQDHPPLERWKDLRGGETAVVWDAHLGGQPVCMVGIESRPIVRTEFVPADGPHVWTAGTLFPQSSRKIARAVNAASGNRPLVVLANLSGFDGSPESMRQRQLEYGAEIGRAVVNFRGPVVFCVVSRYHGGAFVVFSRTLREEMEVVALEGAKASVIGGAPAAAVVFSRDVETRTRADPRVVAAEAAARRPGGGGRAHLDEVVAQVRSEKLGEVGAEFDAVHTIERARQVGSVDRIITVKELRPWLIEAVERGMIRALAAGEPTRARG